MSTDRGLTELVLHPDVDVVPAAQLPPDLRAQVDARPDDVCVTRPRTRHSTSVVDADLAALLDQFRTPSSIVDAVLAFAAQRRRDPRQLLDASFPALAALVADGVLVAAGTLDAEPLAAMLDPGSDLDGGVTIVDLVHLLVDTEVYRGRTADGTWVAVKVARAAAPPEAVAALSNEAATLAALDGTVTPRLVHTGSVDARPFVVTTWHAGVDLGAAAADARVLDAAVGRRELLDLGLAVLGSYAALHAQGVVHGDVHPRNAVVDGTGGVTILDFGLAVVTGVAWRGPRGGIDLFLAPEVAAAEVAGRPVPPPDRASEQYALGALLYHLLTGEHVQTYALERGAMLREIVDGEPVPFARRGVAGLDRVEACLRRALARDPAARYASVAHFRDAVRVAADADLRAGRAARRTPAASPEAAALVDDVLGRLGLDGAVFARGLDAPTASVTYGAAGVAYALLRIARARGDERLLALADLWSVRARAALARPEAVWDAEHGIVPEVFGRCSLYHHASGVHAVRALVAHARGDDAEQVAAVADVVATSRAGGHADLAFGRAGLLNGCALLLDPLPVAVDADPLRRLGDGLLAGLVEELATQADRPPEGRLRFLGAAHGWAGVLFAMLRWCESSGSAVPARVGAWLDRLAGLAEPTGRGLAWPRVVDGPVEDSMLTASWCNGAAGFVHLWAAAHRLTGDPAYADLAERAAWCAYDGASEAPGDLCCGFAGRAYALLAADQVSGSSAWRARARRLAARAVDRPGVQPHRADSLFHGELGIAVLAAELAAPDGAGPGVGMPLVAAEGWSASGS